MPLRALPPQRFRPDTMRKSFLIGLTVLALAASAPAFAQDQDDDMAPPPPRGMPSSASDEMRFDQISEQMRELTGRIEEVQHNVDAMRMRMDKMASDYEMRLQALEHGAGGGAAVNAPATAMNQPPPSRPRPSAPPAGAYAAPPNAPPPDQPAPAAAPGAIEGTLPAGSPQQQYDYAFGLLRDANYPAAERALKDFVHHYPDNRLSSNAQYWLAETYYVRKDYQAAAAALAEGYQRFPRGAKAADDLLKLGSSLAMLGRRGDACRSFAQLDHDFPIAPANVKAKEAEEKRRASCR
jgi:tol-pal system protein YbgF